MLGYTVYNILFLNTTKDLNFLVQNRVRRILFPCSKSVRKDGRLVVGGIGLLHTVSMLFPSWSKDMGDIIKKRNAGWVETHTREGNRFPIEIGAYVVSPHWTIPFKKEVAEQSLQELRRQFLYQAPMENPWRALGQPTTTLIAFPFGEWKGEQDAFLSSLVFYLSDLQVVGGQKVGGLACGRMDQSLSTTHLELLGDIEDLISETYRISHLLLVQDSQTRLAKELPF